MRRWFVSVSYTHLDVYKRQVVGDNENNDFANYLIMTDYTEGDRTIPDQELYEFEDNDKKLNGIFFYDVSIRESVLSNVCRYKDVYKRQI